MQNELVRQVQAFAEAEAARVKLELDEDLKSAREGDADAMYAAAYELSSDGHPLFDSSRAIELYELAHRAGHPLAAHNLGWVLQNRGESDLAHQWFTRAAEAGDRSAMAQLAMLLEGAAHSDADLANAEVWYRKAASDGNADSESDLANFLHQKDRARHTDEIVELTLRASEAGVSGAMFRHAEYLWEGVPVAKDRLRAEHMMRMLAGRKLEEAVAWLDNHKFERIETWDLVPKVSFGPIRLEQPIEQYIELLGLFIDEEESAVDSIQGDAVSWDSAYYPELSVWTCNSRVVSVGTFYGAEYKVLFEQTELMGCSVEQLSKRFDTTDFVVSENYSLSDAEISSAAYGIEFAIDGGEVVDVDVSVDADHELWNE